MRFGGLIMGKIIPPNVAKKMRFGGLIMGKDDFFNEVINCIRYSWFCKVL